MTKLERKRKSDLVMKTGEKRTSRWSRTQLLVLILTGIYSYCGFVFILSIFNIKELEKEKKL